MKRAPRVFVPPATLDELAARGQAPAPDECAHRLRKVLRLRDGDEARVCDGAGRVATARVDGPALVLTAPVEDVPPALPAAVVVQARIRPKKLEQVVQRGTELGAAGFWLFDAARTQGRGDADPARLQRIADDASRQSERAHAPTVEHLGDTAAVVERLGAFSGRAFVGVVGAPQLLSQALADAGGPVAFVIGPEGGLTEDEVAALTRQNVAPVALGAHVLRAETAALAALSAWQVRLGTL